MKSNRIEKIVVFIIVLLFAFISIYPMIWMLLSSFKGTEQILGDNISLWPTEWHFENYATVFEKAPFLQYFWNSLWTTILIVVIQIFFAGLIAYAISQFNFKGKAIVSIVILATYMVPSDVTYIPSYIFLSNAGLANNLWGLVISNAANIFTIFLFVQGFRNTPKEVIQAARVEGASEWRILWRIMMPMNSNLVIIAAITSFISNFNTYRWPNILLTSPENYVLQQGLSVFSTSQGSFREMFPVTMAASVLTLIPCIIVYLLLAKYFIGSASTSTIKG